MSTTGPPLLLPKHTELFHCLSLSHAYREGPCGGHEPVKPAKLNYSVRKEPSCLNHGGIPGFGWIGKSIGSILEGNLYARAERSLDLGSSPPPPPPLPPPPQSSVDFQSNRVVERVPTSISPPMPPPVQITNGPQVHPELMPPSGLGHYSVLG